MLFRSVWFYDLKADGFTLDQRRQPISENSIPEIIATFPSRSQCANSFIVPVETIKGNTDFSLSLSKYKTTDSEVIEHRDPKEILREVIAIEKEIEVEAEDLFKKLV